MQALFAAGAEIPIPIPEIAMIIRSSIVELSSTPDMLIPKDSEERRKRLSTTVNVPTRIGHRYPHLVRNKLVTVDATIMPTDLGVKISPL